MPNTLANWLSYLESLHPKTIALGLDRVAQVKERMALQPEFPVIVVGGTNGKGSVCAMLESILHAAGYRVGCYTSPHLLHYNERVRIDKKQASDVELCASFKDIEQARKGLPPPCRGRAGEGVDSERDGAQGFYPHPNLPPARGKELSVESSEISLTYFEFGTLAAMQLFISHKVDVAILEVGLGGRLDAVNVFDADCAVVTSVDIDHIDYLGDTREGIAFEKAGIFRKDRVAICADPNVPQAIRDHAQQIGAELWCIGKEFGFSLPSPASGRGVGGEGRTVITLSRPAGHPHPQAGEGMAQWDFRSPSGERHALPIPSLRGAFQLHNASAALAALDALKDRLPVSMEAVRRGLVEVQLAGRFQFVPGRPQLILDVAHNPHAARSLAQNLGSLPPAKTYAVFAMLKDKDMAGVVQALAPHIDVWLVAGIDAPRGANADELVQVLRNAGVSGEVTACASIAAALHEASNRAGEDSGCDTLLRSSRLREQPPDTPSRTERLRAPCRECRIAAFGSFYTVAEVMQARALSVT
ncbi:MAG: folylpolyglutamate synthase/dihydrofolate synthase family protein [Gallionella sp.]|nr:folylpolyglutamate synthase/dihydrofolate synthase family protein [Gallionella sp.]